jgi:hypothetical protein
MSVLSLLKTAAAQLLLQAGPGTAAESSPAPVPLRELVAAPGPRADFQPYIFWAYGLACLFLLLFTLWTSAQSRGVARKLHYLRGRFRDAHPGTLEDS